MQPAAAASESSAALLRAAPVLALTTHVTGLRAPCAAEALIDAVPPLVNQPLLLLHSRDDLCVLNVQERTTIGQRTSVSPVATAVAAQL